MTSPLILLLSALAPSAALLMLWQSQRGRGRKGLPGFPETLAVSRHLFMLLIHVQKHRGMSSAWLAGDAGFLPRLRDQAVLVETLLPALQAHARLEGARPLPCFTANEVGLFIFRWRNLVESQAGKQAEQSIAEHGQLIAQLLRWLSALGERRIEPLFAGDQLGRVRNFAHRLPLLTECLGQARAIGSSVAARQACSAVARVRLMFLVGRAEALLDQAAQAADDGRISRQARSMIGDLTHVVRTSMLLNDGVSVSPDAYFVIASRAIDAVVAWIDDSGGQLQGLLRQAAMAEMSSAVAG
ncbi:nitrate- and nitrite sensing domain-containing protein [Dechloromonas denitrificans]|uniref:nitrate- and nitrite sensing domain-containing protein n=1 Tax=Dechloromonas denitrificans TaxID=281362 RepID=UPI001CF80122|nr:nitrate- and nitrite sensing domain-containing protein [Dechloromonas denitrificans]UCV04905.1 nitrate- and nitrite sensing domain-containing protein [Dechloromonas denitrificans]